MRGEVGFADQSPLARCFRRMFGITPSMFQPGVRPAIMFYTGSTQVD
jgi:AraC-like DNA-binding protein